MVDEGIASSCLSEGTGWMLGGSSLRIGCAKSGTGWMMMWLIIIIIILIIMNMINVT